MEELDPSRGKKTLGVYLAPDGSKSEAVKQLRGEAIAWENNIMMGKLQHDLAW